MSLRATGTGPGSGSGVLALVGSLPRRAERRAVLTASFDPFVDSPRATSSSYRVDLSKISVAESDEEIRLWLPLPAKSGERSRSSSEELGFLDPLSPRPSTPSAIA